MKDQKFKQKGNIYVNLALSITVLLFVWISFTYFALPHNYFPLIHPTFKYEEYTKDASLQATGNDMKEIATSLHIDSFSSTSNAKIIILLQQSPVDQSNQLSRLKIIDQSWAKWIIDNEEMNIYAAIPTDHDHHPAISSLADDLQIINPLLFIYPSNMKINPFYHLVRGLLTMLMKEPQLEYLILANDHTFIIPSNLQCLVRNHGFNPDHPIYAGNMLQRGKYKKGYVLHFASGGAGIILSHVSIKLFLLSLAFVQDDILAQVLSIIDADNTIFDHRRCPVLSSTINVSSMMMADMNIRCMIKSLSQAMNVSQTHDIQDILNISLSYHHTSTSSFNLHVKSVDHKMMIIYHNSNGSIDHSLSIDDVVEGCSATSEWDMINPALVLAYCIQKSYHVPYISTTRYTKDDTDNMTSYEKMNCFGMVRTLYGDVDEWYTLAKLPYHEDQMKHKVSSIKQQPIAIARDVVSFHYISQKEAMLLYQILARQISLSSIDELSSIWPKNDEEAGPYARWRFHDHQELGNLYDHLTKHITIKAC